jgi:membrane protease YdiL (CAAX protease family)
MAEKSGLARAGLFLVFLVCILAVFTVPLAVSSRWGAGAAGTARVAVTVLFLAAAVTAYQFKKSREYWLVFFACFTASFALFMGWRFSDYGLKMLYIASGTPKGIAVAKLSEAVIVLFFVLLFTIAIRSDLASIYLGRGEIRRAFAIGGAAFAALFIVGVVQALVQGAGLARLMTWLPWILVFALANGFMEELLFRGVFLRRLEPLVGAGAANVLTALVFSVSPMKIGFVSNVFVFAGITFLLGLVWGYIIQKTDTIWGAALFHAGADVLIVVGVFGAM